MGDGAVVSMDGTPAPESVSLFGEQVCPPYLCFGFFFRGKLFFWASRPHALVCPSNGSPTHLKVF
jgi:hypothetical protein